jgi:sortase A
MRRLARILSVALITAGTLILIDAATTIAWKEPLSAIYGHYRQATARNQLADAQRSFLGSREVSNLGPTKDVERRADQLATIYSKQIKEGRGIGTIRVPSVGIDYVVIQGTETADLQKGPGHYPDTGLPGQGRTVAIAGHRTTYLAPFRNIAEIEVGDDVTLEMPYGTFTYEVADTKVVDPSDVHVVDDTNSERVVLTACHPLYSAAQRYVVTANLTDIELPPGRAGHTAGG